MGDSGYVYVLINPSMEGLVKIGKTKREPNERAKELSAVTGVPTSFVLVFDAYFSDCSKAEEYVHALLEQKNYRVSMNREFFKAPVNGAIKAVIEAQNFFGLGKSDNPNEQIATETKSNVESWHDVFDLADSYNFGWGDTLQDTHEALKLYKQAAKLGSPEACHRIGCILGGIYKDNAGIYDAQQAITYFQEGARRGVGECYAEMTTIFVKRNQFENAHKCWSKYFESYSFSNQNHDRGVYGGIYLEQVKYNGLPAQSIAMVLQIRDEILQEAKQRLESDRQSQRSTSHSEAAIHFIRYLLYPEIKKEVEKGQVKWFENDKGYGFIQRSYGADVFIHQSEVLSKPFYLKEGQDVRFELGESAQGPCAYNVEIV